MHKYSKNPSQVQPVPPQQMRTIPNQMGNGGNQNVYAQTMQPTAPVAASSPAPAAPATYISSKIYKINGKNKVVDFSSRLTVANVEDYANVHGCGGKNHAPNSTIALTICDFSNGTGEKSVTASYNLDVEDMTLLYHAAIDSRLHLLTMPALNAMLQFVNGALASLEGWKNNAPVVAVPANEITLAGTTLSAAIQTGSAEKIGAAGNAVLNSLRTWIAKNQHQQTVVSYQEIVGVQNALASVLNISQNPAFEYVREKNNPYRKDSKGFVPVSKVYIAYSQFRKDGQESRYPWFIQIENFDAPLIVQKNGSSTHDAGKATNRKVININLSADDFAAAMVAVDRFVRLWEMANALPNIRAGQKAAEAITENKKASYSA